MSVYYNEFDAEAADWLEQNIKLGLIAPGDVDRRSITEVQPDDLIGYRQCHFFAGIGGWSFAARLAGWSDDNPLWTGSCPCQPFSVAGKGQGADDARHLWPDLYRLARARRPLVLMGEQVAGKAGENWFDGVRADLGEAEYQARAVDLPSLAVNAPHKRSRIYWVALADAAGEAERRWRLFEPDQGAGEAEIRASSQPRRHDDRIRTVGDTYLQGPQGLGGDGDDQAGWTDSDRPDGDADDSELVHAESVGRSEGRSEHGVWGGWSTLTGADRSDGEATGNFWDQADYINCHDGKIRRVADADAPLLAHGFPNRVLAWRGLGNAINPWLAKEVIGAMKDILK